MITVKEINRLSAENKVSDRQIEKDYILTWVLNGISNHAILKKAVVFKGGTLLKKCYFEDYRFSEDLDFTLIDEAITHQELKNLLQEVFDWVKEEANISLQYKTDEVHPGSGNSLFYADYVGPLSGNMGSRDIKIDITRGERMEFPVEEKTIFKTYSDLPDNSFSLPCYSLSEVLIEKMAALMGRTEARDLYDFWYLVEVDGLDMSQHAIGFENKAKHKNHDPKEFGSKVLKKAGIFERDWETKLKHQMHDLPNFDDVMRKVKKYLK